MNQSNIVEISVPRAVIVCDTIRQSGCCCTTIRRFHVLAISRLTACCHVNHVLMRDRQSSRKQMNVLASALSPLTVTAAKFHVTPIKLTDSSQAVQPIPYCWHCTTSIWSTSSFWKFCTKHNHLPGDFTQRISIGRCQNASPPTNRRTWLGKSHIDENIHFRYSRDTHYVPAD